MNQFFINRWNADFNSPATAQTMLDIASKATALAPSDALARATYAESLTLVGQHSQAVTQINSVINNATADTSCTLRLDVRCASNRRWGWLGWRYVPRAHMCVVAGGFCSLLGLQFVRSSW